MGTRGLVSSLTVSLVRQVSGGSGGAGGGEGAVTASETGGWWAETAAAGWSVWRCAAVRSGNRSRRSFHPGWWWGRLGAPPGLWGSPGGVGCKKRRNTGGWRCQWLSDRFWRQSAHPWWWSRASWVWARSRWTNYHWSSSSPDSAGSLWKHTQTHTLMSDFSTLIKLKRPLQYNCIHVYFKLFHHG